MRADGRANDDLRPITFERSFTDQTPGSVLVSFGRTKVLCTVSIDDDVPRWMRGNGEGWVTAEYAMLPGSSGERVGREAKKGKPRQGLSGRTARYLGYLEDRSAAAAGQQQEPGSAVRQLEEEE